MTPQLLFAIACVAAIILWCFVVREVIHAPST